MSPLQKSAFLLVGLLSAAPALLVAGAPPASDPVIALISRAILDVTRKPSGKDWSAAKRGEILGSGDMVKTGDRSLAIIKFKDNSLVRMSERSELVVTGQMNGSAFFKAVDMETGSVGFSIKKQEPNEEFRFSSPTSVASIRGTGGLFTVSDSTDTLTVLEGTVLLHNRFSDAGVEVHSGWTGVSGRDGAVNTHQSTPDERTAAQNAVKTGDKPMQLELEMHDGKGHTKELKILFKD